VWRLEERERELSALVDRRTGELRLANEELARLAALDGPDQADPPTYSTLCGA
jgi:hypothetical protein